MSDTRQAFSSEPPPTLEQDIWKLRDLFSMASFRKSCEYIYGNDRDVSTDKFILLTNCLVYAHFKTKEFDKCRKLAYQHVQEIDIKAAGDTAM